MLAKITNNFSGILAQCVEVKALCTDLDEKPLMCRKNTSSKDVSAGTFPATVCHLFYEKGSEAAFLRKVIRKCSPVSDWISTMCCVLLLPARRDVPVGSAP